MRAFIYGGFVLALATGSALAAEPDGEWLTEEGAAHVRIVDCNSSKWGVVSWEKTPGGIDENNPDKAKRTRPTLGMPILLNMKKKAGSDEWKGEIYNPENGKKYQSSIKLESEDKLEVKGCVLGFLCGGQTWTRVLPEDGDQTTATVTPPAGAKSGSKMTASPKAPTKSTAGAMAPAPKGGTTKSATGAIAAAIPPANPVDEVCLLPEVAGAAH